MKGAIAGWDFGPGPDTVLVREVDKVANPLGINDQIEIEILSLELRSVDLSQIGNLTLRVNTMESPSVAQDDVESNPDNNELLQTFDFPIELPPRMIFLKENDFEDREDTLGTPDAILLNFVAPVDIGEQLSTLFQIEQLLRDGGASGADVERMYLDSEIRFSFFGTGNNEPPEVMVRHDGPGFIEDSPHVWLLTGPALQETVQLWNNELDSGTKEFFERPLIVPNQYGSKDFSVEVTAILNQIANFNVLPMIKVVVDATVDGIENGMVEILQDSIQYGNAVTLFNVRVSADSVDSDGSETHTYVVDLTDVFSGVDLPDDVGMDWALVNGHPNWDLVNDENGIRLEGTFDNNASVQDLTVTLGVNTQLFLFLEADGSLGPHEATVTIGGFVDSQEVIQPGEQDRDFSDDTLPPQPLVAGDAIFRARTGFFVERQVENLDDARPGVDSFPIDLTPALAKLMGDVEGISPDVLDDINNGKSLLDLELGTTLEQEVAALFFGREIGLIVNAVESLLFEKGVSLYEFFQDWSQAVDVGDDALAESLASHLFSAPQYFAGVMNVEAFAREFGSQVSFLDNNDPLMPETSLIFDAIPSGLRVDPTLELANPGEPLDLGAAQSVIDFNLNMAINDAKPILNNPAEMAMVEIILPEITGLVNETAAPDLDFNWELLASDGWAQNGNVLSREFSGADLLEGLDLMSIFSNFKVGFSTEVLRDLKPVSEGGGNLPFVIRVSTLDAGDPVLEPDPTNNQSATLSFVHNYDISEFIGLVIIDEFSQRGVFDDLGTLDLNAAIDGNQIFRESMVPAFEQLSEFSDADINEFFANTELLVSLTPTVDGVFDNQAPEVFFIDENGALVFLSPQAPGPGPAPDDGIGHKVLSGSDFQAVYDAWVEANGAYVPTLHVLAAPFTSFDYTVEAKAAFPDTIETEIVALELISPTLVAVDATAQGVVVDNEQMKASFIPSINFIPDPDDLSNDPAQNVVTELRFDINVSFVDDSGTETHVLKVDIRDLFPLDTVDSLSIDIVLPEGPPFIIWEPEFVSGNINVGVYKTTIIQGLPNLSTTLILQVPTEDLPPELLENFGENIKNYDQLFTVDSFVKPSSIVDSEIDEDDNQTLFTDDTNPVGEVKTVGIVEAPPADGGSALEQSWFPILQADSSITHVTQMTQILDLLEDLVAQGIGQNPEITLMFESTQLFADFEGETTQIGLPIPTDAGGDSFFDVFVEEAAVGDGSVFKVELSQTESDALLNWFNTQPVPISLDNNDFLFLGTELFDLNTVNNLSVDLEIIDLNGTWQVKLIEFPTTMFINEGTLQSWTMNFHQGSNVTSFSANDTPLGPFGAVVLPPPVLSVNSEVIVSGIMGEVDNISLDFNLEHTAAGEIVFSLIDLLGTQYELFANIGGNADFVSASSTFTLDDVLDNGGNLYPSIQTIAIDPSTPGDLIVGETFSTASGDLLRNLLNNTIVLSADIDSNFDIVSALDIITSHPSAKEVTIDISEALQAIQDVFMDENGHLNNNSIGIGESAIEIRINGLGGTEEPSLTFEGTLQAQGVSFEDGPLNGNDHVFLLQGVDLINVLKAWISTNQFGGTNSNGIVKLIAEPTNDHDFNIMSVGLVDDGSGNITELVSEGAVLAIVDAVAQGLDTSEGKGASIEFAVSSELAEAAGLTGKSFVDVTVTLNMEDFTGSESHDIIITLENILSLQGANDIFSLATTQPGGFNTLGWGISGGASQGSSSGNVFSVFVDENTNEIISDTFRVVVDNEALAGFGAYELKGEVVSKETPTDREIVGYEINGVEVFSANNLLSESFIGADVLALSKEEILEFEGTEEIAKIVLDDLSFAQTIAFEQFKDIFDEILKVHSVENEDGAISETEILNGITISFELDLAGNGNPLVDEVGDVSTIPRLIFPFLEGDSENDAPHIIEGNLVAGSPDTLEFVLTAEQLTDLRAGFNVAKDISNDAEKSYTNPLLQLGDELPYPASFVGFSASLERIPEVNILDDVEHFKLGDLVFPGVPGDFGDIRQGDISDIIDEIVAAHTVGLDTVSVENDLMLTLDVLDVGGYQNAVLFNAISVSIEFEGIPLGFSYFPENPQEGDVELSFVIPAAEVQILMDNYLDPAISANNFEMRLDNTLLGGPLNIGQTFDVFMPGVGVNIEDSSINPDATDYNLQIQTLDLTKAFQTLNENFNNGVLVASGVSDSEIVIEIVGGITGEFFPQLLVAEPILFDDEGQDVFVGFSPELDTDVTVWTLTGQALLEQFSAWLGNNPDPENPVDNTHAVIGVHSVRYFDADFAVSGVLKDGQNGSVFDDDMFLDNTFVIVDAVAQGVDATSSDGLKINISSEFDKNEADELTKDVFLTIDFSDENSKTSTILPDDDSETHEFIVTLSHSRDLETIDGLYLPEELAGTLFELAKPATSNWTPEPVGNTNFDASFSITLSRADILSNDLVVKVDLDTLQALGFFDEQTGGTNIGLPEDALTFDVTIAAVSTDDPSDFEIVGLQNNVSLLTLVREAVNDFQFLQETQTSDYLTLLETIDSEAPQAIKVDISDFLFALKEFGDTQPQEIHDSKITFRFFGVDEPQVVDEDILGNIPSRVVALDALGSQPSNMILTNPLDPESGVQLFETRGQEVTLEGDALLAYYTNWLTAQTGSSALLQEEIQELNALIEQTQTDILAKQDEISNLDTDLDSAQAALDVLDGNPDSVQTAFEDDLADAEQLKDDAEADLGIKTGELNTAALAVDEGLIIQTQSDLLSLKDNYEQALTDLLDITTTSEYAAFVASSGANEVITTNIRTLIDVLPGNLVPIITAGGLDVAGVNAIIAELQDVAGLLVFDPLTPDVFPEIGEIETARVDFDTVNNDFNTLSLATKNNLESIQLLLESERDLVDDLLGAIDDFIKNQTQTEIDAVNAANAALKIYQGGSQYALDEIADWPISVSNMNAKRQTTSDNLFGSNSTLALLLTLIPSLDALQQETGIYNEINDYVVPKTTLDDAQAAFDQAVIDFQVATDAYNVLNQQLLDAEVSVALQESLLEDANDQLDILMQEFSEAQQDLADLPALSPEELMYQNVLVTSPLYNNRNFTFEVEMEISGESVVTIKAEELVIVETDIDSMVVGGSLISLNEQTRYFGEPLENAVDLGFPETLPFDFNAAMHARMKLQLSLRLDFEHRDPTDLHVVTLQLPPEQNFNWKLVPGEDNGWVIDEVNQTLTKTYNGTETGIIEDAVGLSYLMTVVREFPAFDIDGADPDTPPNFVNTVDVGVTVESRAISQDFPDQGIVSSAEMQVDIVGTDQISLPITKTSLRFYPTGINTDEDIFFWARPSSGRIRDINLGEGDDIFVGSNFDDDVIGVGSVFDGAGSDVIVGGKGRDWIETGDGQDFLWGNGDVSSGVDEGREMGVATGVREMKTIPEAGVEEFPGGVLEVNVEAFIEEVLETAFLFDEARAFQADDVMFSVVTQGGLVDVNTIFTATDILSDMINKDYYANNNLIVVEINSGQFATVRVNGILGDLGDPPSFVPAGTIYNNYNNTNVFLNGLDPAHLNQFTVKINEVVDDPALGLNPDSLISFFDNNEIEQTIRLSEAKDVVDFLNDSVITGTILYNENTRFFYTTESDSSVFAGTTVSIFPSTALDLIRDANASAGDPTPGGVDATEIPEFVLEHIALTDQRVNYSHITDTLVGGNDNDVFFTHNDETTFSGGNFGVDEIGVSRDPGMLVFAGAGDDTIFSSGTNIIYLDTISDISLFWNDTPDNIHEFGEQTMTEFAAFDEYIMPALDADSTDSWEYLYEIVGNSDRELYLERLEDNGVDTLVYWLDAVGTSPKAADLVFYFIPQDTSVTRPNPAGGEPITTTFQNAPDQMNLTGLFDDLNIAQDKAVREAHIDLEEIQTILPAELWSGTGLDREPSDMLGRGTRVSVHDDAGNQYYLADLSGVRIEDVTANFVDLFEVMELPVIPEPLSAG